MSDDVEMLRQATREAHEVLKDLRAAVREAQSFLDSAFSRRVEDLVNPKLVELSGDLERETRAALDVHVGEIDRMLRATAASACGALEKALKAHAHQMMRDMDLLARRVRP